MFGRYTTAFRSEGGIKTWPGQQDDSDAIVFVKVLARRPLINRWERFHSVKVTNAVVQKVDVGSKLIKRYESSASHRLAKTASRLATRTGNAQEYLPWDKSHQLDSRHKRRKLYYCDNELTSPALLLPLS